MSFISLFTKLASTAPCNSTNPILRQSTINVLYKQKQIISQQQQVLFYQQTSWLSSMSNKKRSNNGPLMNERLTRSLQHKNTTQVRLILDKEPGRTPPEVNIISLDEAITTASEYSLDLVGINLTQDVPVLKAVNYKKLLYDTKKKKKITDKNSIQKKPKEWSFKTGIDPNDLKRKLNTCVDYLKKGYQCNIVIQIKRKHKVWIKKNDDGTVDDTIVEKPNEHVVSIINTVNEYCKDVISNKELTMVSKGSRGHTKSIRLHPKRK